MRIKLVLLAAVVSVASLTALAQAGHFSAWATAQKIDDINGNHPDVNTSSLDGCPIQSPDGLSLYIASTRQPGGLGGIDLWVAHRPSTAVGFGTPVNLGPAINSGADDFCPTPVRGKGLYFVSTRGGNADIYFSRNHPVTGWTAPVRCRMPSTAGCPSSARPTSRPTAGRSCTSRAARISTRPSCSSMGAGARSARSPR